MKSLQRRLLFFCFFIQRKKNKNVSVRPKLRKPLPSQSGHFSSQSYYFFFFFLSQQNHVSKKPTRLETRGNLKTKLWNPAMTHHFTSSSSSLLVKSTFEIQLLKINNRGLLLPPPRPCKSHNKLRGTDVSREAGSPAASVLPLKLSRFSWHVLSHWAGTVSVSNLLTRSAGHLAPPLLWVFY